MNPDKGQTLTLGERIVNAIVSNRLVHAICAENKKHGCICVWSAGAAEQIEAVVARPTTPDSSLPPLIPEGPRREMLVRISVSADFEKRLDNQWEVEREIQADRWSWEWADEAEARLKKAEDEAANLRRCI